MLCLPRRSSASAFAIALVTLLSGVLVGAGQASGDGPDAPHGVTVAVPALLAEVSWLPADGDDPLLGYRIDVRAFDGGGGIVATEEVGPDADSASLVGLDLWFQHQARVTALFSDSTEASSAWSEPFRVVSTLSLVNDEPIVRHGDGDCCETYSRVRAFELDAPMPVDVWVRPTVVSFSGNEGHDGFEAPDERWPAAVNDFAIRIPAGSTDGKYEINWWGDDWKRFEYATYGFGFEPWQHPVTGGGWVHLEQAKQQLTITEDDPHFWPDVSVDPSTTVVAGRTARVRVRLSHRPARRTVLTYRLKDVSAHSGRDYDKTRGLVTARAGQRVVWVRVPTHRRAAGGRQRQFIVQVTGARDQLARLTKRRSSLVRIVR